MELREQKCTSILYFQIFSLCVKLGSICMIKYNSLKVKTLGVQGKKVYNLAGIVQFLSKSFSMT